MKKPEPTKQPAINKAWFVNALRDAERTQADLAGLLEISPSQISKLFKGERRVQLDEVTEIANFLHKPIREVLINLGVPLDDSVGGNHASTKQIPIIGKIELDGTLTIDLKKVDRKIEAPGRVPPGTAAVVVPATVADSALAVAGLYFFVIPDGIDPGAIGRLAVVRQQRGPWLLRTVRPGLEPGRYDLVGGPNGLEENQQIIAAGPILLIRP